MHGIHLNAPVTVPGNRYAGPGPEPARFAARQKLFIPADLKETPAPSRNLNRRRALQMEIEYLRDELNRLCLATHPDHRKLEELDCQILKLERQLAAIPNGPEQIGVTGSK